MQIPVLNWLLKPWGGLVRINYSGNKKRREEANRKKQEEKRNKRLNKGKEPNPQSPEVAASEQPETPPQSQQ